MQDQLHRYWKSVLDSTLEKHRSILSQNNITNASDQKIFTHEIIVDDEEYSMPLMTTKMCHSIALNCTLLERVIKTGNSVVIDIMKWNYEYSHDLEGFSRQLPRLELATKWLTDSCSLLCLLMDQFSSIYSEIKAALLNHVHFHHFVKCLSELVLKIIQFKNGISQNRFIIVQINKLKQLTQTLKKNDYTSYVESSIDRILLTLEERDVALRRICF